MQEAIHSDNPGIDAFVPVIRAGLPLDEESDMEWRVRLNLHTFALTHIESLNVELEKTRTFRDIMENLIGDMQRRKQVRNDISPADITRAMFDLVNGLAKHLVMFPFDQREAQAEYLFRLIDQLRVK